MHSMGKKEKQKKLNPKVKAKEKENINGKLQR